MFWVMAVEPTGDKEMCDVRKQEQGHMHIPLGVYLHLLGTLPSTRCTGDSCWSV
jgi:hypothetical protein